MIPYSKVEIQEQIQKNCPDWSYDGQDIFREYTFPNFVTCIQFVNSIGIVAESINHHPNIFISWGRVKVNVHTHSIKGIGVLDFKLATELDKYYFFQTKG